MLMLELNNAVETNVSIDANVDVSEIVQNFNASVESDADALVE